MNSAGVPKHKQWFCNPFSSCENAADKINLRTLDAYKEWSPTESEDEEIIRATKRETSPAIRLFQPTESFRLSESRATSFARQATPPIIAQPTEWKDSRQMARSPTIETGGIQKNTTFDRSVLRENTPGKTFGENTTGKTLRENMESTRAQCITRVEPTRKPINMPSRASDIIQKHRIMPSRASDNIRKHRNMPSQTIGNAGVSGLYGHVLLEEAQATETKKDGLHILPREGPGEIQNRAQGNRLSTQLHPAWSPRIREASDDVGSENSPPSPLDTQEPKELESTRNLWQNVAYDVSAPTNASTPPGMRTPEHKYGRETVAKEGNIARIPFVVADPVVVGQPVVYSKWYCPAEAAELPLWSCHKHIAASEYPLHVQAHEPVGIQAHGPVGTHRYCKPVGTQTDCKPVGTSMHCKPVHRNTDQVDHRKTRGKRQSKQSKRDSWLNGHIFWQANERYPSMRQSYSYDPMIGK